MMGSREFYYCDISKPYKTEHKVKKNVGFIPGIVAGAVWIAGVSVIMYVYAKSEDLDAFFYVFFGIFLALGVAILVKSVFDLIKNTAVQKQVGKIMRDGRLTIGTMDNYTVKRMQKNKGWEYLVSFRYRFVNDKNIVVERSFSQKFGSDPCFDDGQDVPIVFLADANYVVFYFTPESGSEQIAMKSGRKSIFEMLGQLWGKKAK